MNTSAVFRSISGQGAASRTYGKPDNRNSLAKHNPPAAAIRPSLSRYPAFCQYLLISHHSDLSADTDRILVNSRNRQSCLHIATIRRQIYKPPHFAKEHK